MTIIELLETSQTFLVTASLVLGLLIGSSLNVIIYRMPIILKREWKQQCREFLESDDPSPEEKKHSVKYEVFNLLKPGSHCPHCNHKIKPWENIPFISYLTLGGKCSYCRAKISLRYPSVELISGILSALVAFTFGATWLTLSLLIFTWSLVVLTLIDVYHQLLPDDITIPLLWLGLLVNTLDLGFGVAIDDAVIGAIAGYLVLWIFFWVFKLITGKEGMGYGDFKLLAALGAWMGWQSLLPIIILSSVVGAVSGIIMIITLGRDNSLPMPFGPYLSGAGFIMLIWGPEISALYISSVSG